MEQRQTSPPDVTISELVKASLMGSMHNDVSSVQSPYKPETLDRFYRAPVNACEDISLIQFPAHYRVLDVGIRFRGQEIEDPPTGEKNISKGAGVRVIAFQEPSMLKRWGQKVYDRLKHQSLFNVLLMKRINTTRQRLDYTNEWKETINEIVIGSTLNAIILRGITSGFTFLVDWFVAGYIAAEVTDPVRLIAECKMHQKEEINMLKTRKEQYETESKESIPDRNREIRINIIKRAMERESLNHQYIIYERLRFDVASHIGSQKSLGMLRAALFQICHALEMAWRTRGFIHYDLHTRNAMFSASRNWQIEKSRRPTVKITEDSSGLATKVTKNAGEDEENRLELSMAFVIGAINDEKQYNNIKPSMYLPPHAQKEMHFLVPPEDSDDRVVKMIDFGRSRARFSRNPEKPDDLRFLVGINIPEFGILRELPQRYYDLRRLCFDMVTSSIPRKKWWEMQNTNPDQQLVRDLRDFFKHAIDIPTLRRVFIDKWPTLQRNMQGDGTYAIYKRETRKWLFIMSNGGEEGDEDTILNALFNLSTGEHKGRRDPRKNPLEYHIYQILFFDGILRCDHGVNLCQWPTTTTTATTTTKNHTGEGAKTLLSSPPKGWTSLTALVDSNLFTPYRVTKEKINQAISNETAIQMNQSSQENNVPLVYEARASDILPPSSLVRKRKRGQ